jgi:hypothetical protein
VQTLPQVQVASKLGPIHVPGQGLATDFPAALPLKLTPSAAVDISKTITELHANIFQCLNNISLLRHPQSML